MALLDFKIVGIKRTGRQISALVRVFRGQYTNVPVRDPFTGVESTELQYKRIAKVLEKVYQYEIPRDMTKDEFFAKARAYFRKKLIDYATANGHTVITDQLDITDWEPMTNESEQTV